MQQQARSGPAHRGLRAERTTSPEAT